MNGGFMDNNIEPKTVGERIKYLREKKGESQAELGKILNRTQMAISKLENDETALTLENQILIAEHYNVSHDYICTGRNNDSVLDLLTKYISMNYAPEMTDNGDHLNYPALYINKVFFDYLIKAAKANNYDMPSDIKEIWIEREKEQFYKSNKNNDFSIVEMVVPLPPQLINPDEKKDSWKQSDLLREYINYLNKNTQNITDEGDSNNG